MKKRRLFSVLLAGMLATGLLAGCGNHSTEGQISAGDAEGE